MMNEGVYKNDSSPKILQGPKEQENTPQNPLNLGEGNGTPVAIIVENFYKDADEVRKFALSQEFGSTGNYPGQRTKSFATEEMKNFFQKCVYPHGGEIINFDMDGNNPKNVNGSFQYTTAYDRSWMHTDGYNNWAALIYLTPDAPISGGTGLFKYESGERWEADNLENRIPFNTISQDLTKWEQIDNFGNIYNRVLIFNANHYHMSLDYFGSDKETGRLFQVFFFTTER
jgi:hypothetical protein